MNHQMKRLLKQIQEIYPEEMLVLVPIANEYEFDALMSAFDTIKLRWISDDKASAGIPYRDKYSGKIQIEHITLHLDPFSILCTANYKADMRSSRNILFQIKDPKFIEPETLINWILSLETYNKYNRPNLPVL